MMAVMKPMYLRVIVISKIVYPEMVIGIPLHPPLQGLMHPKPLGHHGPTSLCWTSGEIGSPMAQRSGWASCLPVISLHSGPSRWCSWQAVDSACFIQVDKIAQVPVPSSLCQPKSSLLSEKQWELHYINLKGKFILSPQEQHQGTSV